MSSFGSDTYICCKCNNEVSINNKTLHDIRCNRTSSSPSSSPASVAAASSLSLSSSSPPPKLNCQISSSLEDLDSLNQLYPFIPNSNSIRPSDAIRQLKKSRFEDILDKYDTFDDYILNTIFNKNTYVINMKKKAINNIVNDINKFYPNEFPYNVNGQHWVMWYGTKEQTRSEDEINNDIFIAISNHLQGSREFNFAWYINPKMTVPEFFHVQVFWTQL
jgi:hypothetical protein